MSVSIYVTLLCHMLYKLCFVKKRPQAFLGQAIKFKWFFEVRKHWVNWFLDELKPFGFDSNAVRKPDKKMFSCDCLTFPSSCHKVTGGVLHFK